MRRQSAATSAHASRTATGTPAIGVAGDGAAALAAGFCAEVESWVDARPPRQAATRVRRIAVTNVAARIYR